MESLSNGLTHSHETHCLVTDKWAEEWIDLSQIGGQPHGVTANRPNHKHESQQRSVGCLRQKHWRHTSYTTEDQSKQQKYSKTHHFFAVNSCLWYEICDNIH